MTKLLHRPLRVFILNALIILVVSIPAYVLVFDRIWTSTIDENNSDILRKTKEMLERNSFSETEIANINELYGELHAGFSITRATSPVSFQDSIFEILKANPLEEDLEKDRFRGLKTFAEINGLPYVILIETNLEEKNDTFVATALVTAIFFLLLILSFLILSKRIARKTWQPFNRTLKVLRSFQLSNDQTINLPPSDIQEFQELNETLEHLVNRNIDTYRQQKSFIENASHELQTPLAILKSKVDILLQEKEVTREEGELLDAIQIPLSRLTRINKNMLLLAKMENRQYDNSESINVDNSIRDTVLLFEDYIGQKEINLQVHCEDSFEVLSNPFLFETMIHNLISNAIRHSDRKAGIWVSLASESLVVSNSGSKALDKSLLFQRFTSVSSEKVSSGLGLAIVHEIVVKYEWEVNYAFQNGRHSFRIQF